MCKYDGGYYAIKGFLYQFDKTMIELLNNEDKTEIFVEKIQDINYDNYVIQVKHKETSTFSNSKIRDPIIQLLEVYKDDNSKKLCLYGYFKDKKSEKVTIKTIDDLHKILKYNDEAKTNELRNSFSEEVKRGFIENFTLCFSTDFVNQFYYLIELIQEKLGVLQDDAIIYHSLMREKLLEIAIRGELDDRKITKGEMIDYLSECKSKIFYNYYDTFLGREEYIRLVKRKYFTHRGVNLNNFERLFIIECNENDNEVIIRRIIDRIRFKFYKKNKSPAPYICLKSLKKERLINIKRNMFDDEVLFSDGTYFDGDKFRVRKLTDSTNRDICVKVIKEENLYELMDEIKFREVYNLFIDKPIDIELNCLNIKIQYKELDEIEKMIG
ncbi:hypothetical protein [Clostridium paraputrificum]|uniref:hypothetical protein n=2 Tax=Clostridium paraputrificum TaxID=29363 RepID=UPI0034A2BAAD